MEPRLETIPEKKLIGQRKRMSFTNLQTRALWQGFMPQRKRIANTLNTDLYSLEVYAPGFFDPYHPAAQFDKWAAVEVSGIGPVPEGMEPLLIPGGLYAVFLHKGAASQAARTYNYIFSTWLPASKYAVDDRPHFAIMGSRYKADDPSSEEEVWIPIKPK